jgi:hypothetical protein
VNESSEPGHLLLKLRESVWTRSILISVVLVIPCFWQQIVSGVDLQSHLYNAWLAELIRRGSIHGLWISHQGTNVLIDLLLPWLIRYFGVSVAERVITTALVLLFFWGAFQLITAVSSRKAYWLTPWLAMLSYGFVFQVGLLNYYFSCAIVLWLFAFLWRWHFGWRTLWAAPLLILAYFAHPLPVLWFLGAAAYCALARRMQPRIQIRLFLGCVAAIILIRCYVVARYITRWENTQLMTWTGVDQLWLHGRPYMLVTLGFLLLSIILLCEPENRWHSIVSVLAQAYFLTATTIALMPSAIGTSVDGATGSIIAARLSLFSAVLLLAGLSRSTYRRWYLPAGLVALLSFFAPYI